MNPNPDIYGPIVRSAARRMWEAEGRPDFGHDDEANSLVLFHSNREGQFTHLYAVAGWEAAQAAARHLSGVYQEFDALSDEDLKELVEGR